MVLTGVWHSNDGWQFLSSRHLGSRNKLFGSRSVQVSPHTRRNNRRRVGVMVLDPFVNRSWCVCKLPILMYHPPPSSFPMDVEDDDERPQSRAKRTKMSHEVSTVAFRTAPEDVWSFIFSLLSPLDFLAVSCACKWFHQITAKCWNFWKELYLRRWNIVVQNPISNIPDQVWKDTFKDSGTKPLFLFDALL